MPSAIDTLATVLDLDAQLKLVEEVRGVIATAPLRVPLARGGRPMRVKISGAGKLGWTADGKSYGYAAAQADGRDWPAIPRRWLDIADQVAGPHPWDSAIVNWYSESASLGFHQDVDEYDLALPIVTISLGDPCRWAVRPPGDRSIKPSACRLESGSVTLLAGETRDYFHAVTKIFPDPLFSPLKKRGRISITIRVAGEP